MQNNKKKIKSTEYFKNDRSIDGIAFKNNLKKRFSGPVNIKFFFKIKFCLVLSIFVCICILFLGYLFIFGYLKYLTIK